MWHIDATLHACNCHSHIIYDTIQALQKNGGRHQRLRCGKGPHASNLRLRRHGVLRRHWDPRPCAQIKCVLEDEPCEQSMRASRIDPKGQVHSTKILYPACTHALYTIAQTHTGYDSSTERRRYPMSNATESSNVSSCLSNS